MKNKKQNNFFWENENDEKFEFMIENLNLIICSAK